MMRAGGTAMAGAVARSRRTRAPWPLAAVMLAGGLLGCATPAALVRYDFGVAAAGTQVPGVAANGATQAAARHGAGGSIGGAAAQVHVVAVPWLDTSALLYRLAYVDDAQVHAYAQSQWVAPPAALLEQALREAQRDDALAGCAGGLATPNQLQVELEEFSQVFDTPQASHVVLRARVRVLASRTRAPLAQRDFDLRNATSTPDAAGAAHGLSALAHAFGRDALTWAAATAAPSCPAANAAP